MVGGWGRSLISLLVWAYLSVSVLKRWIFIIYNEVIGLLRHSTVLYASPS